MDLDALRAFVSVVETGSLVAGARHARMARATLRRRVDELEASAGVRLLHRAAHGVTVTPAGTVLAERGRTILREARSLLAHVREIGDEPAGELRMVLPVGLPPQFLLPLVGGLRKKFPRLCIRLRFADDPVAGLLDDVDVAVHFGARKPVGPFTSFELVRIREWCVASADYLAKHGKPRRAEDLATHRLLAWDPAESDARQWPLLAGGTLEVEPMIISADIHLLRGMAAHGLGIAFLPDARIPEDRPEGERLQPVLQNLIGRERALRVVVPTSLVDIPRIAAVLGELRSKTRPRGRK